MTAPVYSVALTSQTRGWAYACTHVPGAGVTQLDAAGIAALPAVQLADGLTFSWEFVASQVPGPMQPTTATVRLAAKTGADLPAVEKGDLLVLAVRVGAAGAYMLTPAPMRVTEAVAELTSNPVYGAVVTIQLLERRAELLGATVLQGSVDLVASNSNVAHTRWRPRLAELAVRCGWSMACPGFWADADDVAQPSWSGGPVPGNQYFGMTNPGRIATGVYSGTAPLFLWDRNVYKAVDELLNTHHPSFITHTAYSGYVVGYPAGWGKVGPVNQWGYFTTAPSAPAQAVADPASTNKLFLMPASRKADGTGGGLPLVFAVRSGVLTLQPQYVNQASATGASGHARIALDAAWCDLPATVRKTRDGSINQLNLHGSETYRSASGAVPAERATFRTFANTAAQLLDGAVTREVDTQLWLGTAGDSYEGSADRYYSQEAPNNVAPDLLTDDSARQGWVYDQFTVKASRVPADLADGVLSRIAPRAPGETNGDSHVLRHLTIYRPASSVRVAAGLLGGFVAKGQLEVKGGEVTFTVNLTPGATQWVGATPAPITVAQVDAATYQAQPCNTLDPLIRVADLVSVAA